MAQIVNDNKLTYILTNYGLDRVAEVMSTPGLSITLSKIKIGDANGEYYEPTVDMTELKNPIPNGEFPIVEKALLEDNLTVSFRAVIPESFGGCDIREVGIYETIGDENFLFAIGTQQPFVKPSPEYDYFISIDYYAFLKSQNLAEIYDRIYLDEDVALVTELDLEDLMSTVLFSQTNLMDQIGHNSYTIGLNRAAQLEEKIENNRQQNSNTLMYSNYCSISSILGLSNLFSYWLFDYPKNNVQNISITDLGPQGINLSTDKNVNLYNKKFLGVTPALGILDDSFYFLNKEYTLSFLNEEGTQDTDFTLFYCIEPSGSNDRTILARSNYANNSNVFEFKETNNRSIFVRLFSDSVNYLTFTSNEGAIPEGKHSVVLCYNSVSQTMIAFVNGDKISLNRSMEGTYTHMSNSLTTLYAYSATPLDVVYANSPSTPTQLYNSKGAPNQDSRFVISGGLVLFDSEECVYDETKDLTTPNLYAYSYGLETVYVEDTELTFNTVLYNDDHSVYTGTLFKLAASGEDVIIQCAGYPTQRDTEKDIEGVEIYAWKHESSTQFIWANNDSSPTVLYTSNGNLYEGGNWTINNGILMYNEAYIGEYSPEYNKNIPFVEATSYITNENNGKEDLINSYISILGVSKTYISTADARVISMLLSTALGETSCILMS